MDVRTALANWSETTRKKVMAEQDSRVGANIGTTELVDRLTNADDVQRLWHSLTELERLAASLLLREAPGGFMRKRDWEQAAAKVHPHLSAGLTGLRRLGLVLNGRKGWSESGFLMPREVRDHLFASMLGPPLGSQEVPTPKTQPVLTYYIPSGRGIHLDMLAGLLSLREGIPVTREGMPHRRSLQQLADRLSLRDEHVACLDHLIRKPTPQHPAAMVVLDLLLRLGLARTEERRLMLDADALAAWLALSGAGRFARLFYLVRTRYLSSEPWLEALVASLRLLPAGVWNSLEETLDRLRRLGFRLPVEAGRRAREWLHLLLGFGWVLLGKDEEGRLLWQRNGSSAEQDGAAWYVEPTGDVLLPPSTPLSRLWELERIAELSFAGEWLKAELCAPRVRRYANQGGSAAEVLSFLAAGSAVPLPPQLAETVREWARQAGRIRMETVVRVRTADPLLLDELKAMPGMQPFLADVISPTDFLVPLGRKEELADFLSRCGYEPQSGSEEGFRPLGEPFAGGQGVRQEEAAGMFSLEQPWEGFQADDAVPDPSEALPQLMSLPRIWTSHYQSYHPQTLRGLFQRACELHLEIVAEVADGVEWRGVPVQLDVAAGYWQVWLDDGGRHRRFRLDDVRRARILLPEWL